MKLFLNLIFAFFLLTSCHSKTEKIRLNLIKGEVYTQNSTTNISIIETINGQKIKINSSIGAELTYKVIGIQDSVYEMEVNYTKISMKKDLINGVMNYSSDRHDDHDIFSTILGTMINKPFYIKMTNTGKIMDLKNIDSLYENIFNKFPQLSDEQKQEIKDQVMKAYGEKALKSSFEIIASIFPNDLVSEGDEWTIRSQLEAGIAIKIKTIYELEEITDSYYRISGNSQIETANKDIYVNLYNLSSKYDLSGTMTSDIKIDKKSGWIIESKTSQTLEGIAKIKGMPSLPAGMEIPMEMTSEVLITGK